MIKNLENVNGDGDNEKIKESNAEWKKYMLNLSKSIVGNTELFNGLFGVVNDGFLKELNGRIGDLGEVNNVYYDEEVKEEIDFDKLKVKVDGRHEEILNDVSKAKDDIFKQEKEKEKEESKGDESDDVDVGNDGEDNFSKMKELYEGLLSTNINWNELISTSGMMYKESQAAKNNLIEQLLAKYTKLQDYIGKVEKLPSTVLF
eukprot:UN00525